jgi:predicted dehydrogenase
MTQPKVRFSVIGVDWFWHKSRYGGILTDIGSHQVDQFLFHTGTTKADVVSSQVGNFAHKDKPEFEDFGDIVLRGVSVRLITSDTRRGPKGRSTLLQSMYRVSLLSTMKRWLPPGDTGLRD